MRLNTGVIREWHVQMHRMDKILLGRCMSVILTQNLHGGKLKKEAGQESSCQVNQGMHTKELRQIVTKLILRD